MHTTSTLLSLSLSLFPLARASFSLNTSGPDWDYVAKDLANTTSASCITAYSAPIDCDATLLGLVASMRPAFDPTSTDLDNTCTTTCADSLTAYIAGVKKACTADGDAAQEYVGGDVNNGQKLVPVEVVGEVFEYFLKKSCRLDDDGNYCYLSSASRPPASKFSCSDTCQVSFYQMAHDYAASAYLFNYYWLVGQSDWWEEQYTIGWKRLQDCGWAAEESGDGDEEEDMSASSSATVSESASGSGTKTKTSEASAATGKSDDKTTASTTASATGTSSTGTVKAASSSGTTTAAAAVSATASTVSGGAAGMKVGGSAVVGLVGLGWIGLLVL
ncbi:hypothetical protein ACMFMG_002355 [Clarireedia jacksonii]